MSQDFRPREHDHLVEPMLAWMGEPPREPGREPGPERPSGPLARLWRGLLSLVRPSRPADGR